MAGLFGGGGDDSPPAPTRSPKGVKIQRISTPNDSILARGAIAQGAGTPAGSTLLDDGEQRQGLGSYGGVH